MPRSRFSSQPSRPPTATETAPKRNSLPRFGRCSLSPCPARRCYTASRCCPDPPRGLPKWLHQIICLPAWGLRVNAGQCAHACTCICACACACRNSERALDLLFCAFAPPGSVRGFACCFLLLLARPPPPSVRGSKGPHARGLRVCIRQFWLLQTSRIREPLCTPSHVLGSPVGLPTARQAYPTGRHTQSSSLSVPVVPREAISMTDPDRPHRVPTPLHQACQSGALAAHPNPAVAVSVSVAAPRPLFLRPMEPSDQSTLFGDSRGQRTSPWMNRICALCLCLCCSGAAVPSCNGGYHIDCLIDYPPSLLSPGSMAEDRLDTMAIHSRGGPVLHGRWLAGRLAGYSLQRAQDHGHVRWLAGLRRQRVWIRHAVAVAGSGRPYTRERQTHG